MDITININKDTILNEAAMTAEYVGANMPAEDKDAYTRMQMPEETKEQTVRFYGEALADVCAALQECVKSFAEDGTSMTLYVPRLWNTSLLERLQRAVTSAVVNGILARWFMITNKTEAQVYAGLSATETDKAKELLYSRVRPKHPFNEL